MESIRTFKAIEDDVDLKDTLEERLVFYEYVPTLQQIACHEIALKLWHCYIICNKSKKIRKKTKDPLRMAYGLDKNYRNESVELVTFLNMPLCIEEMLKKSLHKIRVEMKTWILYCKEMFGNELIMYCVRDFNPNYCVWFQNGEMDYKKTASKMLSDAELTREQKFVIMCSLGMADDIKRFPLSALSEHFHRRIKTKSEFYYWTFFSRCHEHELVLRMGREEYRKPDVVMAILHAIHSYPYAFEYFWSRLDEADQISVAVTVLSKKWQLQKMILSKMSLYQQKELMSKIPVVLMMNFLVELDLPEYAFKVWLLRAKDEITEVEFAAIIKLVYVHKNSSENSISVLIDIWDTASDRLRNHAVQTRFDILFQPFFSTQPLAPSCSKFLCRFLSLTKAETRKQLIHKYPILLVNLYLNNPRLTIDIVEICCPTDSERMEFKNEVIESPIMIQNCLKLVNSLEYDKLKQMLAFFSSNDHYPQELIEEILMWQGIEVKIFMLDYDKWNKLSNFILEIFANHSSTGAELKKDLISSFSYDAIYYWNKSDDFSEIVKVVEQELSPLELEVYKQSLLKNFQRGIITSKQFWRYFDANCFNTFVLWCLGDEEKVLEFKMIVPVDEIFDDVFNDICGWNAINGSDYEPHQLLNKLDEFLRYFCASHEEVEKFKIRKFNELKEHSFRETWLNCDDQAWYSVLMWFFENDQDEAIKFR